MSWSRFKTRVSGKWTLAGEHSVLRGATAIALPHPELGLSLSFDPGAQALFSVEPSEAGALMAELIQSVAESWEEDGRSFPRPQGQLSIESSIPIGAGLGSSAALCVALTRWMADPLMIPETQWIEFATHLEHRFHGRSSGMDVAVIAFGEPISYGVGKGITPIGVKKLPKFTFHDTTVRSRTSECVLRVEKFRQENPVLGIRIDDAMGSAARTAMEGLVRYDAGESESGLKLLQSAMAQARECFYSWELVPGAAKKLEEDLLRQGALGVKLTGSGGGGMVVALWPDEC